MARGGGGGGGGGGAVVEHCCEWAVRSSVSFPLDRRPKLPAAHPSSRGLKPGKIAHTGEVTCRSSTDKNPLPFASRKAQNPPGWVNPAFTATRDTTGGIGAWSRLAAAASDGWQP